MPDQRIKKCEKTSTNRPYWGEEFDRLFRWHVLRNEFAIISITFSTTWDRNIFTDIDKAHRTHTGGSLGHFGNGKRRRSITDVRKIWRNYIRFNVGLAGDNNVNWHACVRLSRRSTDLWSAPSFQKPVEYPKITLREGSDCNYNREGEINPIIAMVDRPCEMGDVDDHESSVFARSSRSR